MSTCTKKFFSRIVNILLTCVCMAFFPAFAGGKRRNYAPLIFFSAYSLASS